MKILLLTTVIAISAIGYVNASGAQIVAAARSQLGVPYSWGGGNYNGKSLGIKQGAHTVGFDCSGLAQYAVYHGTEKILARTAAAQYSDPKCKHVAYGSHQPGDLVFFNDGGSIHHVAIISGPTTMIEAPHTGAKVREVTVYSGRMALVQRCF